MTPRPGRRQNATCSEPDTRHDYRPFFEAEAGQVSHIHTNPIKLESSPFTQVISG